MRKSAPLQKAFNPVSANGSEKLRALPVVGAKTAKTEITGTRERGLSEVHAHGESARNVSGVRSRLARGGCAEKLAADSRHDRVVAQALRSLEARARMPGVTLNNPRVLGDWFRLKLSEYEHEVVAAAWLDNRLRLIEFEILFHGTYDRVLLPVREVVKSAFRVNAAAVAFAHNHPSGCSEPSEEDVEITRELRQVLAQLSVRLVDHLVVTASEAPRSITEFRPSRARKSREFALSSGLPDPTE